MIFCISCMLVSFLYSQMNVGGGGWLVPSNVIMWTTSVVFIGFTLIRGLYLNRLYVSNLWFAFGGMLLLLITLSTVHSSASLVDIFVYWLAMLLIWLFVGALQQYRLGRKELLQFAFVVSIFAFIQAFISLVQTIDNYKVLYQLTGYYPFKFSGRPVGTFQQVNMLASFLAFGLVLIFYVLTSPAKHWGTIRQRWLLVFMTIVIFYVLLISGSRAGFLGFIFALGWMVLFRYKTVLAARNWVFIWLVSLSIGFVLSLLFAPNNLGFSELNRKFFDVMNGSDIRAYLYTSTFRMFLEGPLLGYGLGNFNNAYLSFISHENIPKTLDGVSFINFTHPHNELLFWMIQSGIFCLMAIIVFVIAYLKALWKYSKSWGLLLLGLISPLFIQSQLSYPFSLSAAHLFVFLVLLTFGLKGYARKITIGGSSKTINQSSYLKHGIIVFIVAVFGNILCFSWLTLKGIKEAYYFDNRLFLYKNAEFSGYETQGYFNYASKQPMFSVLINHAMQEMAKIALEKNNQYDMHQYIMWSNNTWLKEGKVTKENVKNSIFLVKIYFELGEFKKAELLSKRNIDYLRLNQTDNLIIN